MARTSTINIRHTSRGTTIRATGAAAQALCNVINHAAEIVAHPIVAIKPAPVLVRLVIAARYANNTYEARALPSEATTAAGLQGLKATCTSGQAQAIGTLLAKAVPPLRVAKLVEQHVGPGYRNTYTIDAEEL